MKIYIVYREIEKMYRDVNFFPYRTSLLQGVCDFQGVCDPGFMVCVTQASGCVCGLQGVCGLLSIPEVESMLCPSMVLSLLGPYLAPSAIDFLHQCMYGC